MSKDLHYELVELWCVSEKGHRLGGFIASLSDIRITLLVGLNFWESHDC